MDIFGTHLTASAAQTQALGESLAGKILKNFEHIRRHSGFIQNQTSDSAVVICLYGELGSGKTTFSQGFACGLGLNARLLSPTFLLLRSYDLPGGLELQHFDLYQIGSEADINGLGFFEIISQPTNIVLIEWAEKLGNLLPEKRIDIHFRTFEDEKHEVKIERNP